MHFKAKSDLTFAKTEGLKLLSFGENAKGHHTFRKWRIERMIALVLFGLQQMLWKAQFIENNSFNTTLF